ncbi:MAG: AsmA-like C-terminal region-containing protein, partial [Muriicola sp.]|nr:AsmA-like C-terminal region-containing protein [Muriicola sp.]
VINAAIINTSGLAKDTYAVLQNGAFSIDDDQFSVEAKIDDLLGNPKVDATMQAQMNLANIANAYPMEGATDLKGNLNGNISAQFDMASIEKKDYQNTRTLGQLTVADFEITTEQFKHPIALNSLAMDFNPARVALKEMKGTMGDTDFEISGTITNLLGFLFNNENVEGNFNMMSDTFAVNNFMVTEESEDTTSETSEAVKIPSFLESSIRAQANTVLYDDLALKEVKGLLTIKDETVTISELTSSLFQGKLAVNGTVSTKNEEPTFEMNLGASDFRIGEAFSSLELFQLLAPAAKAVQGSMNTEINIAGNLNNDFSLNFTSITGNVLAELFGTELKPEQAQIVSALGNQLQFIKPENIKLDGLKTALSFENGRVQVKPFTVNYQDIDITVNGSHSFDRQLNYTATFNVPAKYLGSEVNTLIAKIDEEELQGLTVPVTATIGGMYTSPKVQTDLTSGIKNVTTQLVAIQKQKMLAKGKEQATDLIGSVLSGKSKTNDTLGSQSGAQKGVEGVLGTILGKGTQKQDTASQDTTTATRKDVVKESATSILGGLLRKKKKDTAKAKDTIN